MNYTADNAVLPAKNILVGVALICAVLFFLNVWRRTWQLPSVGLALLVLSAILLGMIWPAIVQQFQVKPSEADKESPYIAQEHRGHARGLRPRPGADRELHAQDVARRGVHGSLAAAAELGAAGRPQAGQRRPSRTSSSSCGYYSVAPVLDVDRYSIDDEDRALVLGVRELDQSRLSADAQNWSNLHTAYTHGNGLIAAYANQRDKNNVPAPVVDGQASDDGAHRVGPGHQPRRDRPLDRHRRLRDPHLLRREEPGLLRGRQGQRRRRGRRAQPAGARLRRRRRRRRSRAAATPRSARRSTS